MPNATQQYNSARQNAYGMCSTRCVDRGVCLRIAKCAGIDFRDCAVVPFE